MGDNSPARGSITWPRHIFVSGADAGLRNRWIIGSRTSTTAAKANKFANSCELPEITKASSAANSPSRIGASKSCVRHWAAALDKDEVDGGVTGRWLVGRLLRDSLGGNGSTLSLRERISSISRSIRDLLEEAGSSGLRVGSGSFTVSSWNELHAGQSRTYGTVRRRRACNAGTLSPRILAIGSRVHCRSHHVSKCVSI